MPVAAIILATGAADAGGRPLALERLSGDSDETLIEWEIRQIRLAAIRDVVVVLGRDADEIIPLVAGDSVEPIVDARWASGPASALRTGASAVPRGTDAAFVGHVEEPRPAWVYERLLTKRADSAAAVRPTYEGRPGSPVLVDAGMLTALRNLTSDAALEDLLAREASSIVHLPLESPIVTFRLASAGDLGAFAALLGRARA